MSFAQKVRLASKPLIMGIMNLTPDSFSLDGLLGRGGLLEKRAEELVLAGADILDLGGESTRPGSEEVSLQEELDRVIPAIERISAASDIAISVDTYKPEVMEAAAQVGVVLINDINALQAAGALEVCAKFPELSVCLMHKKGNPKTMQEAPFYQDVVAEVADFLEERVIACNQAGIASSRLLLDPGFGFGKNLAHNVALFKNFSKINIQDIPWLIGVSRKTMLGELLDLEVTERTNASVVAALLAAQQGAKVLRVHDVLETRQALSLWQDLTD